MKVFIEKTRVSYISAVGSDRSRWPSYDQWHCRYFFGFCQGSRYMKADHQTRRISNIQNMKKHQNYKCVREWANIYSRKLKNWFSIIWYMISLATRATWGLLLSWRNSAALQFLTPVLVPVLTAESTGLIWCFDPVLGTHSALLVHQIEHDCVGVEVVLRCEEHGPVVSSNVWRDWQCQTVPTFCHWWALDQILLRSVVEKAKRKQRETSCNSLLLVDYRQCMGYSLDKHRRLPYTV